MIQVNRVEPSAVRNTKDIDIMIHRADQDRFKEVTRAYEVRVSYGPNGWQGVGVFTQARRVVVENLTPGTTYSIQARAVGGSTGYSDWSDPVSHMAL